MPKNKGKGGKNVKRGKNQKFEEARELVFKEDGQECVLIDFCLKIATKTCVALCDKNMRGPVVDCNLFVLTCSLPGLLSDMHRC